MMNLNNQSTVLSKTTNNLSWAFLIISFLGFVDATYLTIHHYVGIPLPCTILNGCEVVTTSAYSMIGPIPIALLGAFYYMGIFFLVLFYREMRKKKFLYATVLLVGIAFTVSVWLVYLQGFVLHSWCQYCLVSAVFTTILCVLSLWMLLEELKYDTLTVYDKT